LNHVDPGFDPSGLMSARVALRPAEYGADGNAAEQTFLRIADDLRARPGVTATALTSQAPLGPGALIVGLVPEGRPVDDGKSAVEARLRMVSPRYLATMRIPLVAGRDIDERDRHDAPPAIVVSAGFARRAWPGQSAVGKRLWCCGEKSRDGQPAWR